MSFLTSSCICMATLPHSHLFDSFWHWRLLKFLGPHPPWNDRLFQPRSPRLVKPHLAFLFPSKTSWSCLISSPQNLLPSPPWSSLAAISPWVYQIMSRRFAWASSEWDHGGLRLRRRRKGSAYTVGLHELDAHWVRFQPLYHVGLRPIVQIERQKIEGLTTLRLRRACFGTQKWTTREQKGSRSRHHSICQNNFFIQGPKPQQIYNDHS